MAPTFWSTPTIEPHVGPLNSLGCSIRSQKIARLRARDEVQQLCFSTFELFLSEGNENKAKLSSGQISVKIQTEYFLLYSPYRLFNIPVVAESTISVTPIWSPRRCPAAQVCMTRILRHAFPRTWSTLRIYVHLRMCVRIEVVSLHQQCFLPFSEICWYFP